MEFNATEIIGYLAMIVLMVSFLFKDMAKLRMVNSVACLLFVVYGLLLQSYPIAISNIFILVVNLYYLLKPKKA